MPDHVHMLLSLAPKCAVSQVVGARSICLGVRGTDAHQVAQNLRGRVTDPYLPP